MTVLIKKYPNGKLYIPRGNTEPVGYVTLPDLVAIIRKGKELKVIDSKSGEDITVKVLKPALVEIDMEVGKLMELLRG
jgi:polyhydroxyalkanoate synthesis regulator protein